MSFDPITYALCNKGGNPSGGAVGVSHITLATVISVTDSDAELSEEDVAKIAEIYNKGDAMVLSFPLLLPDGETIINYTTWMNLEDYAAVAGDEMGAMYISPVSHNQMYMLATGSTAAFWILNYRPGANTASLGISDAIDMIKMGIGNNA